MMRWAKLLLMGAALALALPLAARADNIVIGYSAPGLIGPQA
jgi:hypothetical protein